MNFSMNDLAGLLGGGGNEAGGGGGIMQLLGQIFGGGAGGGGAGGISKGSLLGLLGGPAAAGQGGGWGLQGVSGHQQVWTPGGPQNNPNNFPPGFPPANIGPTPTSTAPDITEPGWSRAGFDPGLSNQFNLSPMGFSPPTGLPGSWQGPTQIPTFFNNQGYPIAVPVQPGEYQNVWSLHTPQKHPT